MRSRIGITSQLHINNTLLGTVGECNKVKHRNQDLQRALAQKSKDHARTQELYDKARGRGQMEHIEQAAESAADRTIQASTASNRYVDHFGNVSNDENQPAGRFSIHNMSMQPPPIQNMMGAAMNRTRAMNGWNGIGSQGKYVDPVYVS